MNLTLQRESAVPHTLPVPSYSDRAVHALTKSDKLLITEYMAKLEQACAKLDGSALKVTIDLYIDQEENARNIVVATYFEVDADTAFSYWDIIGQELDTWASGPDGDTAIQALELISTSVRWRH